VPVVSGRELDAAYGCCNGRHGRADLLELSPADDQDPVEAVPADGADPAFGERVRRRGPERVRMISTPSLRKASSKTLLNLLSRSWIRKRIGVSRSESDQASWRACWPVQVPLGFAVRPARCTCRLPSSMKKSYLLFRRVLAVAALRLYGREVTSDASSSDQTDLRTPQGFYGLRSGQHTLSLVICGGREARRVAE